MTNALEDGIHFGLDEQVYHALPHLGSTDVKTLYASPSDYWWSSHMNPLRVAETQSYAQFYGHALHHCILYGEASFDKNYVGLSGETGDSVSAEALKTWIRDQGGAPAKLKEDNLRMVSEVFKTNLLTEQTYDAIRVASAMILKNPNLAAAFVGGWPEVSIIWHEGDVPCKARIDYFKKRAIVDLKSFRSKERIQTLDRMVLTDMFNYRYDVQIAHYQNGRAAARELFKAGKVFGHVRPDYAWLSAALEPEQVGWVFCFFKADGMPISKSYQVPWGSPAHQSGAIAVKTALDAYRDNLEKFGTDAWVVVDPPYNIDAEDLPKWL